MTGIDIGSASVRVAVAEYSPRGEGLRLLALVKTKSSGLKHGHITHPDEVTQAVLEALKEVQEITGTKTASAFLSVSGVGLETHHDSGSVAVSRADKEVSEFDVNRIVSESEIRAGAKHNSNVIHTIPVEYKLDGKKIVGKPLGLSAGKLEIKTLFVTASGRHLADMTKAVEAAGIEVEDIFAAPVAESMVTLTTPQKNAGCVIANIGAETVTIMTFEEGLPTSLKVFPLGSNDITNDVALGLKISLEEAEELKKRYSYHDDRRVQKKVGDIIEARLSDIFELIDTHLRKIGRSSLLPAGIVFTGEGAHTTGIAELAKKKLNLPARVASNLIYPGLTVGESEAAEAKPKSNLLEKLKQPEWSTAYGLCILGLEIGGDESVGIRMVRKTRSKFMAFLKQFLP